MTLELTDYYALQLWKDYCEAVARYEAAHEEYLAAPRGAKNMSLVAWMMTEEEKNRLLALLRATPEHKAAFGW